MENNINTEFVNLYIQKQEEQLVALLRANLQIQTQAELLAKALETAQAKIAELEAPANTVSPAPVDDFTQ